MSPERSTTSMSRLDAFFTGASLRDCTKLWYQLLYTPKEQGTTGVVSLAWTQQHYGAQFRHEVVFQQQMTALTPAESLALLYRSACYVLIDRMPDRSLQESFDCLRDVLEWSGLYDEQHLSVALPPKPATPAKVVERRESPDFYVED